jgi:branched-subunit amino acid aminotransferase/4-amino-4-deoxychorismate lyase
MHILNDLATDIDQARFRAIYFGDMLFTTILLSDGKLNHLDRHFRKLQNDLREAYGYELSHCQLQELLQKIDFNRNSRVKLCFSTSGKDFFSNSSDIIAWVTQSRLLNASSNVSLMTLESAPRLSTIKWSSYGDSFLKRKQAIGSGYDDYLGVFRNEVLETSTSSIVFYNGRDLVTPMSFVYPGISREFLIDEFDVKLRTIKQNEFIDMKGAFIINSISGARKVSKINEITYQSEKILDIIQEVNERFFN